MPQTQVLAFGLPGGRARSRLSVPYPPPLPACFPARRRVGWRGWVPGAQPACGHGPTPGSGQREMRDGDRVTLVFKRHLVALNIKPEVKSFFWLRCLLTSL